MCRGLGMIRWSKYSTVLCVCVCVCVLYCMDAWTNEVLQHSIINQRNALTHFIFTIITTLSLLFIFTQIRRPRLQNGHARQHDALNVELRRLC